MSTFWNTRMAARAWLATRAACAKGAASGQRCGGLHGIPGKPYVPDIPGRHLAMQ